MLTLPKPYSTLISPFAPHFSKHLWKYALVLLLGAMLAPHQRTVTAVCVLSVGTVKSTFKIIIACSIGRSGRAWPSAAPYC